MLPKMGGDGVGIFASVILLLCIVNNVNSYSKYGRSCQDIGCLPNEECTITHDLCSYTQREGQDCGSYPTCKQKIKTLSSFSSMPVNPSASSSVSSSNTNSNGVSSSANGDGSNQNNNFNGNGNGKSNSNGNGGALIDPHYVFGAPYSAPIMPDMPIFPYKAPTQSPSFHQFPQSNYPGSALNPGYPKSLQPYNPSIVFGHQPYFPSPSGTGGPPGSNVGGLAPYYSAGGFSNPNMYNKPPPQYQNQIPNQNTYNRQTQSLQSYSSAARIRYSHGFFEASFVTIVFFGYIAIVMNTIIQH